MSRGKIDSQIVIVGKKKRGKSTLLKEIALRHIGAGAATFVQDEFGQFKDILPWYESPAHYHWEQIRRSKAGEPQELSAAIGGDDAEELSDYVLSIAERVNLANSEKVPYAAILYDEVVNIPKMSASHIPPKMEKLLAKSRHYGIALAFLCQDPVGQLPKRVKNLATDLMMFRITSKDRVETIAEQFGIEKKTLLRMNSELPDRWNYLHIEEESFVSSKLA